MKTKFTFILSLALAAATSAFAQQWSGTYTLTNGQNWTGNITLAGDVTINVATSHTATISGVISGPFSITKTGSGTLVLNNANTYTGATVISVGWLSLSPNGSIETSSEVNVPTLGTLELQNAGYDGYAIIKRLNGNGSVRMNSSRYLIIGTAPQSADGGGTFGGQFFGTNTYAFLKRGQETLTLNGASASQISGAVEINGGTLDFKAANNLGTGEIIVTGAALRWAEGNTADVSARLRLGGSGAVLDVGNNRVDFASPLRNLSSSVDIYKRGSGTLVLWASTNTTGLVTVLEGTLMHAAPNVVSGNISVSSGATVNFWNASGAAYTYSGVISGQGNVLVDGNAGTPVILQGVNTYTGKTTVSGNGYLQIASAGRIAGASEINIAAGGNLALTHSADLTYNMPITGGGQLQQAGTGLLTLTNATYTGNTGLVNGRLRIASPAFASPAIYTGGQNNVEVGFDVPEGQTFTYNGSITGPATGVILYKYGAGKLILTSNSHTYSGRTSVNAGVLQVGNGAAGNINSTSNVIVSVLGTLRFEPNVTDSYYTFGKVISGTGSFEYKGPNKGFYLTAANTYTGGTTVEAGYLYVGGNAGSIAGNVTVQAGATFGFGRSSDLTFAGLISGAGNVDKYENNKVTLAANNTYTGKTTISGGTLAIGASPAAISTDVALSGNGKFNVSAAGNLAIKALTGESGTEVVLGSNTLTFTQQSGGEYKGGISGPGALVNSGSGVWRFSGAHTGTGSLTVAGAVMLAADWKGNVILNASRNIGISGARTIGGFLQLGGGSGGYIFMDLTTAPASKLTAGSIANPANVTELQVIANTSASYDLISASGVSLNSFTLKNAGTWTSGELKMNGSVLQLVPKAAVNAEAPVITTQPLASQTVRAGAAAQPLAVTAAVSDGGVLSYQWYSNTPGSGNDGTLIPQATAATYTPPAATAGTTYYHVRVTNTNNNATANKTAATDSNPASVTVFTVTGVTVQPAATAVRRGATQQFAAAVSGNGNPPQTVTWSVTGGVSGTSINSNGVLTVATGETATQLTVRATSAAHNTVSGTATVTVPAVTGVTITPAAVSVQKGKDQLFAATVQGTGGTPSQAVTWSVSGGVAGTYVETLIDNSARLAVSSSETAATLTLRATSNEDARKYGTATVTVSSAVVTPEVLSISVSPAAAEVQKGNMRRFVATVVAVGGASTAVTWALQGSSNAATTIDSDGALVIAENETAASIVVTAASVFNPSKTATATVTVTGPPVTPPTVTSVTVLPASAKVEKGKTQPFTATVQGANNPPQTVTWTVTGNASGTTSIDASTGLLAVSSTETAATLTVRATSTANNTIYGEATVTVEEPNLAAVSDLELPSLKAYPNPFTGTLHLAGAEGCTLRVLNAAGVTVHVQKVTGNDETVRLEKLPAGVYFLRLEKEGKAKTVKVIKN